MRAVSRQLRSILTRRNRVVVLGALLLGLMVPRLAGAAPHDHDFGSTATESCAACIVGHSPVVEASAPTVLPPPLEIEPVRCMETALSASSAFSFAAPLACGPPA